MTYSIEAKNEAFVASGDLSALQNRIVKPLSDFIVGAGTVGQGFGVLQNAPKNTEHAAVATDGVVMVRVGAAVSAGDWITSAASGWGITVPTSFQVGSGTIVANVEVIGKARTGAASGMLAAVALGQFTRPTSVG